MGYINDWGCCELITEVRRILRELHSRPKEDFDLVDLHILLKIQGDLADLVDQLYAELVPHDDECCHVI